jgi:hypothetical protein
MTQALVLEVINTRLESDVAEVTVQYMPDPLTTAAADLSLAGQFIGPTQSSYPLVPLPSEDGFVRCRAAIPTPAFWSPASPNLYRAYVSLTDGESVTSARLDWGFKVLTLKRKAVRLHDEPLHLCGVRLEGYADETELPRLHRTGINTLLVPLNTNILASLPRHADERGFLVLYEVNPEDDAALWDAEEVLFNHVSTLGFVLPRSAMREPQLWHNAMLHLHAHRRDVYVGVLVDEVPIGLIQGHVEFLLAAPVLLEELVDVKTAKLAYVRRADLGPDDLPPNIVGHISRTLPAE